MHIIEIVYKNNLLTEATHLLSGTKIITDPPLDNNGKGQAFSPTDLVCSALGSCMLTIMGIVAAREEIDLENTHVKVSKTMASNPRRISEIEVNIAIPFPEKLTEIQAQKLKNAAHTCPVAESLSSEIKQIVRFNF